MHLKKKICSICKIFQITVCLYNRNLGMHEMWRKYHFFFFFYMFSEKTIKIMMMWHVLGSVPNKHVFLCLRTRFVGQDIIITSFCHTFYLYHKYPASVIWILRLAVLCLIVQPCWKCLNSSGLCLICQLKFSEKKLVSFSTTRWQDCSNILSNTVRCVW